MSYVSSKTITTVAQREIQVALKSKAIVVSYAIVIVVMIAGIFVAGYFMNKDEDPKKLAVVGTSAEPFEAASRATASSKGVGTMFGMGSFGPSGADTSTSVGSGSPTTESPAAGTTAPNSAGTNTSGTTATDANTAGSNQKDNKPAVQITTLDNAQQAEEQVKNEDIDGAIVKTDTGFEFLYKGTSPDTDLAALVSSTVGTLAQSSALDSLGISPDDFHKAMSQSQSTSGLSMKSVEDNSDINHQSVLTVLGAVTLMTFFIVLFAANIGGRVTEEKSSRVVEIILAAARPMDLLAGKIIANTVIGFIGAAVLFGLGLVALKLSGVVDSFSFDYSVVPLMLVAFILGMLLFGSLYAAAGSLVSRSEDLQSTQSPIMMLIFAMTYAPVFGWMKLDSTIMQVLSWIPPTSLSVAPLQMVAGNMSLVQVLCSYAVALVVVIGILALVARIYKNAILHNGTKMTWKAAITGK